MNEQDKNTQNTSTGNTENKSDAHNANSQNKADSPNLNTQSKVNASTSENKSADRKEHSATSNTETVKDTAKGVYDQAKNTAGQAYGVATKRATEAIEEKKGDLAGGLTSVAESIKQVGENLRDADSQNQITETAAKYGDTLAQQIEKVSAYFEKKDVREMIGDAERFARRNPAIFIGAAFGIGLLAARFLKSSPKGYTEKKSFKSDSRKPESLSGTAVNAS
jgi:ElaB/YqjD/DUF883 family membrane-anchored ribosome-binding protein